MPDDLLPLPPDFVPPDDFDEGAYDPFLLHLGVRLEPVLEEEGVGMDLGSEGG